MAANIFASKRKSRGSVLRDVIFSVVLFIVVISLFMWGVTSITQSTEEEKRMALESAITKATVQCYAVEGHYPVSVTYLEENYGIIVDWERYIVHYDSFAENLMPQIQVLPKYF